MKIVLDNIVFSLQRSGGVSTLWFELIKYLTKFKSDLKFVEYIDSNSNIYYKDLGSVNKSYNEQQPRKKFFLERYRSVSEPFKDKFIFISSYYRYCNNPNAINITIVHDFTYEYYRKGIAKMIHTWQKNKAIKNSDGIICISQNTKNDLLKFIPSVDQSKIRVIYNGVSDSFYKINEDYELSDIDINFEKLHGKQLLIYIGHRTAYKNFDLAVEAFSKLDKNMYHLLIIGEKFLEKELEFINNKLDINSYTSLVGIDNVKLNYIYNKAFALLYPSSYEGFGIPLIEAMKTGLPIIAAKNSSIPEVVGDATDLIEDLNVENIVIKILDLENEQYRLDCIKKGFEQTKKFSWSQTMQQYKAFMGDLYKSKNR